MSDAGRFRMRDLERLTGVGRETIRYYIREGLLPEPERPRRNTAWYGPEFVERLRAIRELQQKRFLPLHVIKAVVTGDVPLPDAEVRTLHDLEGKVFSQVVDGAPRPPEILSAVAKRVGLRATEIREMADIGVITVATRNGKQWIEPDGIRVVELWGRVRRAGFTEALGIGTQNLRLYLEMVQWLAREEIRIFTAGVTGKVDTETSARMAEDGITIMNELVAELRKATLLRYIAQGGPSDAEEPEEASQKAVGVPPRIR
ncbi:MAG TPA: MerR family transcriptional regulator [Candidatus Binatia bacterium]|nr:MerR family transcriptional regulator [Candidatus Binatia bacterium]